MIGEAYHAASEETFDSSHDTFHSAFPGGFFWEVLEVLSPPPLVSFKWRHFGRFEGPYKGFTPTGERIEMFGVSVVRCADDLRIVEPEHFYDKQQVSLEPDRRLPHPPRRCRPPRHGVPRRAQSRSAGGDPRGSPASASDVSDRAG